MSEIDPALTTIRTVSIADVNFIYATWLPGLYYGNSWFREIDRATFFKKYNAVIQSIIDRKNTEIRIVCLKEDEDVILAYSVIENDTLHWVFTKPVWRKLGFARLLVPDTIKVVTHLTATGKSIKPREWKFDPFLEEEKS